MNDMQQANSTETKEYGTFVGGQEKNIQVSQEEEKFYICVEPSISKIESCKIHIERNYMSQINLEKISPQYCTTRTIKEKIHSLFTDQCNFSLECLRKFLSNIFPVLKWLPQYSAKDNLLLDVLTGVTLLILHVPQSMAYAQLASVPPIYGLYTSFYPVLIYFFLGTSRHISIGTFSMASLLTGTEIERIFKMEMKEVNLFANATEASSTIASISESSVSYSKIQIAVTITFTIGIIQTLMGLFRMGYLSCFMSDEMISAFITGTVIHIITSQLKSITGAQVIKQSGPFNVVFTWVSLFQNITTVNYVVLLISLCSFLFLIFVKKIINSKLLKNSKIPFPAELILVVSGTLISKHMGLNRYWDVLIVGPTPTGLKSPEVPPLSFIPKVLVSSLIMSIICAATTLSIVLIYAKKYEYEVDPNQELLAYGISGMISSFFFCIPGFASLSRSALQENMGAKSQVCSLVSCGFMLIVLLALGPLFEALPNCVLSIIIILPLNSMLMHFKDLGRCWKLSKLDASVWITTFLAVVFLDMDYGLIIGIIFSLFIMLYRFQYPEICLMGNIPGTEIYKSTKRHPNAVELIDIKIFHFGAPIYFGNRERFQSQLCHFIKFHSRTNDAKMKNISQEETLNRKKKIIDSKNIDILSNDYLKVIILEFSAVGFIDTGGISMLIQVIKDAMANNIEIYFACINGLVLETLENHHFFTLIQKENLFPTVHDAVLQAQNHYLI